VPMKTATPLFVESSFFLDLFILTDHKWGNRQVRHIASTTRNTETGQWNLAQNRQKSYFSSVLG
jgi:hypothetical protein